ncbi:MAG: Gx transporter family protein [Lachnospiraceae bacterium]|nr:Gx transporter family protein [Lachnospiraceae bacterium]
MDSQIKTRKIAYLGLLVSLGMIFSYVESLLPFNFGIPGVKLGIANIVTVLTLYLYSYKEAYIVSVLRVMLMALLFANLFSLIYSLCGALISLSMMILAKRFNKLSIVGVSIVGGVFHNIAQLFIAVIIVNQLKISYYGPILIMSGLFTGAIVGFIASMMKNKLKHMFDYGNL